MIMGIHTHTSYNIAIANNDGTGSIIVGQDLENFSGKSRQIISGLDTTSSNLFFSSGTWASVANQDTQILCVCFLFLIMMESL